MRRGAFTRTLISGFILASSSIAQSAIDDFSNKIITIKPFVEVSTYSFDIKAPATGARLIWKPSERAATGIDIYTHKRFGFSLGLGFSGKGGLTAEDQVKKGNTKFEDWRFSLAYENAYLNANYQRYTGFYLENSDAADNTWNSSKPYRQESAMYASNASVAFTWVFQPDEFSFDAALEQSARQEETAGSWLAGAAFSQAEFSNDSGLIPTTIQSQFGSDKEISRAKFLSATLRVGYGQTIAWSESFFTSLLLMFGAGPQMSEYKIGSESKSTAKGSVKSDVVLSTGYSGESFLTGVIFKVDATTYTTESLEVPANLGTIKFYLGTRF